MKKYFLFLTAFTLLAACSSDQEASSNEVNAEVEENNNKNNEEIDQVKEDDGNSNNEAESSQSELTTVEHPDSYSIERGDPVYVEGEILVADSDPETGLIEPEGYVMALPTAAETDEAYEFYNISDEELYVGDEIEIRGIYDGFNESNYSQLIKAEEVEVIQHNDGTYGNEEDYELADEGDYLEESEDESWTEAPPKNCNDFSSGEEVFAFWTSNEYYSEHDPLNLDGDGDGLPCEALTIEVEEDFMIYEDSMLYGHLDTQEKNTLQENEDPEEVNEEDLRIRERLDENGEAQVPGMGHVTHYATGYDADYNPEDIDFSIEGGGTSYEMGPMKLNIRSLGILDIEYDETANHMNEIGEEKRIVFIEMETENQSEDDVSFHPDSSVLTTNTGEQVESEIAIYEEIGGTFYWQVQKHGQVTFILDDMSEDLKTLTLIISPPHSSGDYTSLSEELRISFDLLDWEEAKEYGYTTD